MFDPRSIITLAREPIRLSGRPHAHDVEVRLDVSARHLRVADWGRSLERVWDTSGEELAATFPGLDHGVVITAAPTLVFASSVAALDSCASALAYWCDYVDPRGREVDVGALVERRARATPPFARPEWADEWLAATTSDPRWGRTADYRHRQLHRIVSRSHQITIVDRVGSTEDADVEHRTQFGPNNDPDGPSVDETYGEVVEFAIERWSDFWTTLAASP